MFRRFLVGWRAPGFSGILAGKMDFSGQGHRADARDYVPKECKVYWFILLLAEWTLFCWKKHSIALEDSAFCIRCICVACCTPTLTSEPEGSLASCESFVSESLHD